MAGVLSKVVPMRGAKFIVRTMIEIADVDISDFSVSGQRRGMQGITPDKSGES